MSEFKEAQFKDLQKINEELVERLHSAKLQFEQLERSNFRIGSVVKHEDDIFTQLQILEISPSDNGLVIVVA